MAGAIQVKGLREMQRAFAIADKSLELELRAALRESAEPVRLDAEHLAATKIRNILSPTAEVDWWRMRVGVTRSFVYIVPNERGKRTRANRRRFARPNLADLMMGRAMEPALDQNQEKLEQNVGHVLDAVGRRWESV